MNKEEAIKYLQYELNEWERDCKSYHETKEALKMAIEALSAEQKEEELAKDIARQMATIIENEQDMRVILKNASAEPTDLISRADAEAFVCMERCGEYRKDCPAQTCPIIEHLDSIPSADRPSGEWIRNNKEGTFKVFTCSECGLNMESDMWCYCPNCGAKMGGIK